jgi:glycerol-3-phosphate O-acyltransferase
MKPSARGLRNELNSAVAIQMQGTQTLVIFSPPRDQRSRRFELLEEDPKQSHLLEPRLEAHRSSPKIF